MARRLSLCKRFGWIILVLPIGAHMTSCVTVNKIADGGIDTLRLRDTVTVIDTLQDTLSRVDTVNVHDTLTVRDTVSDTVDVHDTLTVRDTLRDTARISIGPPEVKCVGLILGDMPYGSNSLPRADSCYAHMTITSNPSLLDGNPRVNEHILAPTIVPSIIGGFLPGQTPVPDPHRVTYEGQFSDTANTFVFNAVVPYFADAGASTLSYDTLADTIGLPSVIDSLVISDGNGLSYDSVDFFGTTADSFRIPLDRDLHVAWKGTADWFGIECRRYLVYGGNYYVIGRVLDSITSSAHVTIPREYFFQDTSIDDSTYDFLYVSVIGVNGPKPDRWEDVSSFGGAGMLIAMRGVPAFRAMTAFPTVKPKGGVGKTRAVPDGAMPPRVTALEILSGLAGKFGGSAAASHAR